MNDTADKNISLHPGGLKLTQEAFEHALLSMTAETGKAGLRAARRNKFQVKILDIGCGIGTSLAFLCKDKKYLGTGIDSSEEAIDKAKSLHPDISFRVCSASHIPFDDESFDIVLSECVLTLLDDPGYALKKWVRLLKGNGCLIISGLCKRQGDELHDPGSNDAAARR